MPNGPILIVDDELVKPASPVTVRARVRNQLSLVRVSRLEESYRDAIHSSHFDPRLVRTFMSSLPEMLEVKAEWDERESELAAA